MSTCINNTLTIYIIAIIVKHLNDADTEIKYSIRQKYQKGDEVK